MSGQNTVGANVLKRLLGSQESIEADFEHGSRFYPGHEMRMRDHANRIQTGEREERKRIKKEIRERKQRARRAAHKRKQLEKLKEN